MLTPLLRSGLLVSYKARTEETQYTIWPFKERLGYPGLHKAQDSEPDAGADLLILLKQLTCSHYLTFVGSTFCVSKMGRMRTLSSQGYFKDRAPHVLFRTWIHSKQCATAAMLSLI